jgi:transmembrane sensor
MHQENFWNLIAKKLSGEASASELIELEQHLRANPEMHYSIQPLTDLWHGRHGRADANKTAGKEAFERHLQRMEELGIGYGAVGPEYGVEYPYPDGFPAPAKRRRYLWAAAALPLLALAIFSVNKLLTTRSTRQQAGATESVRSLSEISTRNGSKTTLLLPDGTKVWLNAGSRLSYDSSFGRQRREVSLTGEGYFDVVHNKDKPFIIHASKINIKVLGTEFDIKSYPSDKTTEASLIRGSIEVTFNDQPTKKVILKPNEKIVVDNFKFENHLAETADKPQNPASVTGISKDVAVKALTYEHKTGDVIETSWVENKLVFQDESFEEIARKLERWYGVTIRFGNERLKADHLTGSFTNETVRQALDALKFTTEFSYSMDSTNNIKIL